MRVSVSIVFKNGSSVLEPLYSYDSKHNYCKPPHASERIAGHVPDNVNCKSPHVVERISGHVVFEDYRVDDRDKKKTKKHLFCER